MQTLMPELYAHYNRLCTHVLAVSALVDANAHTALRNDLEELTSAPPPENLSSILEELGLVVPAMSVLAFYRDSSGTLLQSVLTLVWQFTEEEDGLIQRELTRLGMSDSAGLRVTGIHSLMSAMRVPAVEQMEVVAALSRGATSTWQEIAAHTGRSNGSVH